MPNTIPSSPSSATIATTHHVESGNRYVADKAKARSGRASAPDESRRRSSARSSEAAEVDHGAAARRRKGARVGDKALGRSFDQPIQVGQR
jgi:hypothetical protein